MTTYPHRVHLSRPRGNPWLIAVVILSGALIGLGTWVLVDRTTSSSSTQGLASPSVVAMLRDRIAAVNSGNAKAVAAFYTPNAVLEERDVTPAMVTKGSNQIGAHVAALARIGMPLQSTGPVIQLGTTVAEAVRSSPSGVFANDGYLLAYKLAPDGRIAYQWVLPAQSR